MNKLESALKLARNGFRVIPLRENDKRPLYPGNFQEQATNNSEAIKKLWNKTPNANIGIATGNGLTVIDIDTPLHGGQDGETSLLNYEMDQGFLKDTFEVSTPTGGKHLYYRTNKPFRNQSGVLPGIDVRGLGGYVVAPGSVINGKTYKITKAISVSYANDSVIKLLEYNKKEIESLDPLDQLEKGYSETLIPCGERTNYLVSQCAQLMDGTKSIETIKAMIKLLNEKNLENPLTERELEKEVFPSIDRFKKHTQKTIDQELLIDPKVALTSVSKIEKKAVEWLIPGYIPKGAITILGGDGGLGKTSLWCNIASAISNGSRCCLQDGETPKGKVIYFSGEDDTSKVLRERLELNGADLENISTIPIDSDYFSSIAIGGNLIETIVETERPILVIFDPIQQFIKDTDMTKRNDMRQTMSSLTKLGKQYGTAFLLVMHTNKRDKIGSFRDKLSDSADLWDISRSVLAIGRNQEKELFITHEKSSYCPRQSAITFSIDGGKIVRDSFEEDRQTYIDFMGGKSKSNKTDMKKQLKAIYLELLEPGEQVKKDLENKLLKMGYTNNMIRTVYQELQDENTLEINKTSDGKSQGIKTILKLKPTNEK
jgi:RecA-family ATPase